MKYTIEWTAQKETNYHHTAATKYIADGFILWKGRREIISCIRSANEWHLIRTSDGKLIKTAKTAKECMGALEYCIRKGVDIYSVDHLPVCYGAKFNEDFSDYALPALDRAVERGMKRAKCNIYFVLTDNEGRKL